jgi:hydrogenase 3 maturation protease
MSSKSWHKQLWEILTPREKTNHSIRLVLVGVGNELNADDAVGPEMIHALAGLLFGQPEVLCLDAGLSPENFSGPIRRFDPDIILFIDAADFDEPPGTVQLFQWQAAGGLSASTHTLPLSVLAQYLINTFKESGTECQVALLGIQPAVLEPYSPVSIPVRQAIQVAARELADILIKFKGSDRL